MNDEAVKLAAADYHRLYNQLPKLTVQPLNAISTAGQAQRAHPATAVGQFTVSKISNGYLVECRSASGNDVQLHYAEDLKVVGELISGTSKRWVPLGEDR